MHDLMAFTKPETVSKLLFFMESKRFRKKTWYKNTNRQMIESKQTKKNPHTESEIVLFVHRNDRIEIGAKMSYK